MNYNGSKINNLFKTNNDKTAFENMFLKQNGTTTSVNSYRNQKGKYGHSSSVRI